MTEPSPGLYLCVARRMGQPFMANQTVLDYTGLTWKTSREKTRRARVLPTPRTWKGLREERHEALTACNPFELEQRALGKDGKKYRWFLVRYNRPSRRTRGAFISLVMDGDGYSEDRKRAEERMRNENLALRSKSIKAIHV